VNNAQTQRNYCTVNAPIDGVVTDVETQLGGMMSSASVNAGGGTTAMTVSDMSRSSSCLGDESDIGGVELGQPVEITADAFPNKIFSGKVVLIATLGINTSNVVTFNVKIEVTSPNRDLLKLLMTANVKIIESTRKAVVMVPMMAVIHRGSQMWVSVVKRTIPPRIAWWTWAFTIWKTRRSFRGSGRGRRSWCRRMNRTANGHRPSPGA